VTRSRSTTTLLPRIPRDVPGYLLTVFTAPVATEPFQAPEDLTVLTDQELADLEAAAVAVVESIAGMEHPTDEDADEAERVAGVIASVREVSAGREEAAEARRARISGAREQVVVPAVEEPPAEEVVVPNDASELTDPAQAVEPQPEAVTASPAAPAARTGATAATRVRAADVGTRANAATAPQRRPVSLTAAPDAPGVTPNSTFDSIQDVADVVGRRASEYPETVVPGSARVKMRHGIAILRKDVDANLVAANTTDSHVLEFAAQESRLRGGSLVAAGGWCAPSETLYDLVELEAADGLLDLPEIQVRRGGIRFTPGPSFSDIYSGVGRGFSQTEAQAIAGDTKPCYKIDCPDFTEVRAGVEGLCITNSILQNTAYPELTARVVRGALAAHAHRISAKSIAKMVAGSTVVAPFAAQGGGVAPVLNAVELGVEDYRYKHRMPRGATLEAVFPAWVFGALRADLAFRSGLDALDVTDAMIRAWFTARGIVPQFVYDWQDTTLGAATAAAAWPTTLQFMLYAAGTWVRGMGEVISLDTVYDSAGLAQNEYVGLFTEEKLLVAKLGHDSRLYTVPISANGVTAAQATIPSSAAA